MPTSPVTASESLADRREYLRRCFLILGTGELAAAVSFAFAMGVCTLMNSPLRADGPVLWAALLPLDFILIQGGGYWLAARSWVKRSVMPASLARAYRVLVWINPVLLLAGLAAVVWWQPAGTAALLAAGCLALGVVEYVNYFWVRLSYPWRSWPRMVTQWRPSRLRQDLDAQR